MRIALLSWESLHSIAVGGVAPHVSELAASLTRKGHQVHVFTRSNIGQRCHECVEGVHYHRCVYEPDRDFVDDINNMCRSIVDRVFEIEDLAGRFDIIHAHDWLTANAMIWIKQGRGHVCLLTIHSTEYARCGNAFPGGQAERIRYQERAGTYWADRVIAVSQATKDEICWMYEVPKYKAVVIYNGVNPQRFDQPTDVGADKWRCGLGPMDPTILFCGRMVWQKGPDLLLEAASQILREYPSAKFVFVGDGDMRESLQIRARESGLGHAVRFLGYHNGDELVRLFKMADAVCLPSRNEPFGIVVLEAWSAGKPVIATQNGGPNEYVQHEVNGLKIYPMADSVAWGIRRTFSDFDRARWMGHNGRKTVEERFAWDTIADQTLSVYEELCRECTCCLQQIDGGITMTSHIGASCDSARDDRFEENLAAPTSRGTREVVPCPEAELLFLSRSLTSGTEPGLTCANLPLDPSGVQPLRRRHTRGKLSDKKAKTVNIPETGLKDKLLATVG